MSARDCACADQGAHEVQAAGRGQARRQGNRGLYGDRWPGESDQLARGPGVEQREPRWVPVVAPARLEPLRRPAGGRRLLWVPAADQGREREEAAQTKMRAGSLRRSEPRVAAAVREATDLLEKGEGSFACRIREAVDRLESLPVASPSARPAPPDSPLSPTLLSQLECWQALLHTVG